MTTWAYPVVLVAAAATVSGDSYAQTLYIPAGRSIYGAATLVAGSDTVTGGSYTQTLYIPSGRSIYGAATQAAVGGVGSVLYASRFITVPGLFLTVPYYYWGAP